jgi:hypothetical protein
MSANDLVTRRKQLDEEIKAMAEKEKAAVDEELAEATADAEQQLAEQAK